MEIQQCKVSPRFPLESRLSQSHSGEWKRFRDEKGAIRAGNVDLYFALLYLHNGRGKNQRSAEINSDRTPLRAYRFGSDLDIPAGSYLDFEPLGVLCLATSARSKGKKPKSIFVERSGVALSVRN